MANDTTISLKPDVKEELSKYRSPDHDNWSQVVEALLDILIPPEDLLSDGCTNCGQEPFTVQPIDHASVLLDRIVHEPTSADETIDQTITDTNYYCSPSCFQEMQDEIDNQFPEEPDVARIGGKDELPSLQLNATFYIDGMTKELNVPAPGAFKNDRHDYTGEPVFIGNNGEWVQWFSVEDILHEDATTTLLLKDDYEVAEHRPDESPDDYLSRP